MDGQATNIHTIVKAQIVFLLSTLTEDNFERNQVEIRSLSEQHGIDTYLHFIRRLIVHSQARLSATAASSTFDTSTALTFKLLVQEIQRLARDPFLADRFRDGVDKGEGDIFRNFDLVRFADRVGLEPLERLVLASSIAAAQTRKELATQATAIIRQEFENAVLSLCHNPSFDHADLSPNQVAKLMSNLLSDPPPDSPVLDPSQRQALIAAAQTKYGKETVAPILHRIFPNLSLPPGASLVQVLIQLGPDITSDADAVRALLVRFGISDTNPPRDAQVKELLSALGRSAADGTTVCDVGALVRALSSFSVQINWATVIKSFDWPDRHGVDTATLKLLIAILLNSPRDIEPHAVTGFWSTWSNPLYQLRLLDALLSLPADTFNFVQLPGRRIVTVDDVSIASPTIKSLAANVQGHTWNSLDLFEVLVKLADSDSTDIKNCIREMLDKAIKISAELVHMGLLQVPPQEEPWNEIRREYSRKLLGMFLAGHPNHQLVFMRIWQIKPKYLTDAFRDFYQEDPLNITRILDVAQDLKILESLLDVRPFGFALDVAALASRREYLNLDKWLSDNVANHGAEFLHDVIEFLEEKMHNEKTSRLVDPSADGRTMALSPSTITIILRMLRSNAAQMSAEDINYSLDVRNTCLQVHPRLMTLTPGSDVEPGFTVVTYSPEIEAEVDSIYKQMYDENTSIDDVIAMLQQYKESSNPRDHEVFSCMLHFLFDEYKFFQSYYPTRELTMTGYLFGSLIQHSLIDYIPLGIAIRYILDALSCPPESNLFKFGVTALGRFEFRLAEWKPLCEALVVIPALAEARPELIASIQRHLAAAASGDNAESTTLAISAPQEPSPVFTAIKADALEGQIEEPPEELSDKILFIVNNLAPSNFEAKLAEMKDLFDDEYARWFANYLVDQRISSEPNNHSLYLRFLDQLGRQSLTKLILHETYVKSVYLINSEKTTQPGSERNTLKNIGSWLGSITLARDRPIKHRNLAFKELLLEGCDSGRTQVAITFICKVLSGCADSKVFRPPNPWLMAVMSLLAELYHYGELKINFKFEIEVLCKTLNVDLDTLEASNLMRNRPMAEPLGGPGLPEYVTDIDSLPIGDVYSNVAAHLNDSQVLGLGPSSPADSQRAVGAHVEAILLALSAHVHISPQLSPLHMNPAFKRVVQNAVDRAVREIILPVVERSVTIAGISTRELVTKDFATEPNEERLRKSGHMMAQKLAGSLALVTCKEPLKSNLAQHLRHFMGEHGFAEQEQVIMILVQDNLEVACSAIEKAAMERAVAEVDDAFASSYEARRRHRESRTTSSFYDPNASVSNFSSTLPDPLRIRPNGLQANQLGVYEDFTMDPRRRIASRPSSTMSFVPGHFAPSPAPSANNYLSHQDAMERFAASFIIYLKCDDGLIVMTRDLEAVVAQLPGQSLSVLPSNHDVRYLFRQILSLASQTAEPHRTPLLMSQKIVQLLYKTPSPLGREVYVALIDSLCRTFDDVAKEALTWLQYAEDERKYNVPVTVTLLRAGLINVTVQDQQLAKNLFNDPRPNLQAFVAGLIRECLTTDPPVATHTHFTHSIEVIQQLSQSGKATEETERLLLDLGRGPRSHTPHSNAVVRAPSVKPETEQLRDVLFGAFQKWVALYQQSSAPEKSFVQFISELSKKGILKQDDLSSLFFRVCAEASVNNYIKCMANGDYEYAFHGLDAGSRLIVYMVKYQGDAFGHDNDAAKVLYLGKILSIFVLVLAKMHEEQGVGFQHKPFFRFFSSLLNDLYSLESQLGSVYFKLLLSISDVFSSLQPTYFPGFAFSWMCLISHRLFMPKLLLSDNREGWPSFHRLLISLFKFLSPFLKDADLQPATKDLYRGVLRLLLVLLHDFPDFLSGYYFTLCDVIPPRCIQLRNIILSAFPSSIVLPDPHLRNITFDSIPELGPIPMIMSDYANILKTEDLRSPLDQYLQRGGPPTFLLSLKDKLRVGSTEPETYNLSLINSLVMYIGVSSIAQAKALTGSTSFVANNQGVSVLQYLAANLDVEGQHHLLSAMVLHLRYPNAHTHWFISLLLHLFTEVKDDCFREIMTKVLMERFIVHRPHPWGALTAFIELLRNPKYDFWNKQFIHVAPEVTLLLESVRRRLS
ncbi:Not1-domain-containing protein [Mycena floridula]|nr:Not1-domain-containing protein [Mycena floridula]